MRPNVVMIDLHASKNWCIGFLQCSHDTFTISDLAVEAFHHVVLNFTMRAHMALKGRTPAEAAGIQVLGEDKWLTLIQNAANPKKRR